MATAKLSRAKLPSRKRGGKPDGRLWRRLALGLALVALAVAVVKLLVVLVHTLLGQEQEQDTGVLANVNLCYT